MTNEMEVCGCNGVCKGTIVKAIQDKGLFTIASGFVVLAWPVSVEGFMLEQSPDLSPQSWTDVLTPVVDTATEHTVTVPITGPRMFFRLKKP